MHWPPEDSRIATSVSSARAIAALFVSEVAGGQPAVLLPRAESHLVIRFGTSARNGLDAHVFGARQRVHRKVLQTGQRSVTARLRLEAQEAVLGVPATDLAGRVVALEDLWGSAATRRLLNRLVHARNMAEAAVIVESMTAERLELATRSRVHPSLALVAAEKLAGASVRAVALDLGVSERHLRRLFRDAVGVSPKTFAKLARFQRALHAAREDRNVTWANIAAASGYYDQAHLIAEFRAISGVTPRALIGELRGAAPSTTL
jgi:AraC-like DNA-binding protein